MRNSINSLMLMATVASVLCAADLHAAVLPTSSRFASSQTDLAVAPVAQLSLTITDDGDNPIAGTILVGEKFWVDFAVQDLRSDLIYAGIIQAGTNILCDSTHASPTGNLRAGSNYQFGFTHDLSAPGIIVLDSAENFDITSLIPFPPLGSGVELVARAQLTANAAGTIEFHTQIPFDESILVKDGTGIVNENDPNLSRVLTDAEILNGSVSATITVPEPASFVLVLLASAICCLCVRRQRRWARAETR